MNARRPAGPAPAPQSPPTGTSGVRGRGAGDFPHRPSIPSGVSDRYTAAREALADYDAKDYMDSATETAEDFAELLREIVAAPVTASPPEVIAAEIVATYGLPVDKPAWRGVREAIITAVRAGIDAAWCSWEPEATGSGAVGFRPEGEPDEYRDLWAENMPRVSGRMYFAIPGEQPIHVSDEQARRVLEMLSEDAR